MIIFKDLITGDEMFTDSSKVKLVNDCIWEVEVNYVMRKQGDIAIDGFNPSAEDLDEGTDETSETGYDLVLNQRLIETSFTKADFKNYLKTYTKGLQEKWKELDWDEDKISNAKAKLIEGAKKILPTISNEGTSCFMGESSNPDGCVGILEFRDGDDGNEKAYMIFFKHGLEEEKV